VTLKNSLYILINAFKVTQNVRIILQSHAKCKDQKHI